MSAILSPLRQRKGLCSSACPLATCELLLTLFFPCWPKTSPRLQSSKWDFDYLWSQNYELSKSSRQDKSPLFSGRASGLVSRTSFLKPLLDYIGFPGLFSESLLNQIVAKAQLVLLSILTHLCCNFPMKPDSLWLTHQRLILDQSVHTNKINFITITFAKERIND